MRAQIITCNSMYDENNKWVDGYHEIHEIDNLKGSEHFIATIESVIRNNIKFKNDNSIIDKVIISANDDECVKQAIHHFKDNSYLIDIEDVESYMSIC